MGENMEPSYQDQIALAEYLLNRLEIRLAGREEPEILDRLPYDKYHLGVLGPWKNTMETSQPEPTIDSPKSEQNVAIVHRTLTTPVKMQNQGNDEGSTTSELENEESGRISREDILRKRGVPSAIGMEFVVEKTKHLQLDFDISFSFYTRRFPTW